MVLIANQEQAFFSELSDRVRSRLQTSATVHFEGYGSDALRTILHDRVRWGLQPDVITADQLETIADTAAGDARVAIGILRTAASRARHEDRERIPDELIEEAVSETKTEIQQKTLDKLNTHQTIVYDIIVESGEIYPGELYDRYRERASNPRSEQWFATTLRNCATTI